MKLLHVPPRQGVLWVKRGIHVFARAPLAFCMLMTVVLLAALVLSLLKPVGVMVTLAIPPLVSLGFMIAARRVIEKDDRRPTPMVFIEPLRAGGARMRSMLKLCVAYAVLFMVIVSACDWASGNRFDVLLQGGGSGAGGSDMSLLGDSRVLWSVLLCLTLLSLLSLAFWHAPALIYWGRQSMSQSLFSSTLACWRSRGAFAAYGLAWIGLNVAASWLLALALLMVSGRDWLSATVLPLGLVLTTMFYASLYFTFADSFGDDDEPALQQDAPWSSPSP